MQNTHTSKYLNKLLTALMVCIATLSFKLQADEQLFKVLDANANDFISLDETNEHPDVRLKFGTLDSDQDGQLSYDEFIKYQGGITFDDLDVDRDSKLTIGEAKRLPELLSNFSALDIDRDTRLNAAEFSGFQAGLAGNTNNVPAAGANQ